jgi:hypothetical protein
MAPVRRESARVVAQRDRRPDPDVGGRAGSRRRCVSPYQPPQITTASAATSASTAPGERARHHARVAAMIRPAKAHHVAGAMLRIAQHSSIGG